MRAVVQRVTQADVTVEENVTGAIRQGLVVLLGVEDGDTEKDADYIAEKVAGLRIFDDADGVMNRSVLDIGGGVLSISQFTLLGDVRKGKRPSYSHAARPEEAKALYAYFNQKLTDKCKEISPLLINPKNRSSITTIRTGKEVTIII